MGLLLLVLLGAEAHTAFGASQWAPQNSASSNKLAFLLGYDCQLPAEEARSFVVSVKALNGVSDAGERRQERELAQAGEVLRKAELVSFQSALVDAKAMSAPNTLRDWIEDKFHELSKPAVESPDERADSKVHPDVDSTLAVLDESARLAKAFQSKSTLIRSWILLADGPDSLWYHDLGAYIATSREEPISGIDPAGLEADANHLLSHRPASVPPNIVTDLELLGDSRHVATITHHSIGTEFRILTALIGAPWNR